MSKPILTKVIAAWDYRQADISEFAMPFEVDREQLAESFLFLRKKYADLVPVEAVESGDIVTLRCRSEKPKFQKDSITVNVGKNLYSRELEAQLPGMTVGEQKDLSVGGVAVSVQVLKAERNTLPELTDEFLCKTFPEIHTMAELEAWYANDQFENHVKQHASMAAEYLKDQVLANSQIEVDQQERQLARAGAEKTVREMWKMNGLPLDQMTDEQAQEILGCPNAQAYIDWFADLCEKDVPCSALGYDLLSAAGKAPTEESYQEALRKMIDEEGTPVEQLSDYTFPAYVRQVCTEHYHAVLEAHAYEIIKEKLT